MYTHTLYMHMHTHMHTHAHHIHVHTYMHTHTHIHLHAYTHAHTHVMYWYSHTDVQHTQAIKAITNIPELVVLSKDGFWNLFHDSTAGASVPQASQDLA